MVETETVKARRKQRRKQAVLASGTGGPPSEAQSSRPTDRGS